MYVCNCDKDWPVFPIYTMTTAQVPGTHHHHNNYYADNSSVLCCLVLQFSLLQHDRLTFLMLQHLLYIIILLQPCHLFICGAIIDYKVLLCRNGEFRVDVLDFLVLLIRHKKITLAQNNCSIASISIIKNVKTT